MVGTDLYDWKFFGSWIFTTDQYDPQKNKFQERILFQLRSCLSDTYDPNAIRYFSLNNDYFFSVMISQTKFTIEMIWGKHEEKFNNIETIWTTICKGLRFHI